MNGSIIKTIISEARAAIHGDYISKWRAVDVLLDLRSAAVEDPALVAHLDELLATIPGISVAANEWWRAALETTSRLSEGTPEASPLPN
ncbi:MAG: hypothetical protein AAF531_17305 [Actinomycetota bacterium]